jgi:NDP-sugar pyrophosphorylase family protein
MVLAAGLGTRMQPFTLKTPKALMPLLGVPCIDYSLLQVLSAGINTVVVNVHSHAEEMLRHLQKKTVLTGMQIEVSDETDQLLGSAGGFRKAVSLLETIPGKSEPFFALNADVVSLVNLQELAQRHFELSQQHGVEITLCLARGETTRTQEGSYTEILVDESSGLVTGTGAKKNKVPFYTGTGVFETKAFTHLKADFPAEFVPEVLLPKIAERKVGFFWMEDLWLDIGTPSLWWKSHFILNRAHEQNRLPPLWNNEILQKRDLVHLSTEEGIVNYDLSDHCSRNQICFKGVKYAV